MLASDLNIIQSITRIGRPCMQNRCFRHFLSYPHPEAGRGSGEEKAKRARRSAGGHPGSSPASPHRPRRPRPQPRPNPQTHFELPPPLNDDQCPAWEPEGGRGLAGAAVAEVTGGSGGDPRPRRGRGVPGGFCPGPRPLALPPAPARPGPHRSAAGGGGPARPPARRAPRRPQARGAPPSACVSAPRTRGRLLRSAASPASGAMGCGNSTAASAGAGRGERGRGPGARGRRGALRGAGGEAAARRGGDPGGGRARSPPVPRPHFRDGGQPARSRRDPKQGISPRVRGRARRDQASLRGGPAAGALGRGGVWGDAPGLPCSGEPGPLLGERTPARGRAAPRASPPVPRTPGAAAGTCGGAIQDFGGGGGGVVKSRTRGSENSSESVLTPKTDPAARRISPPRSCSIKDALREV